MNVADRLDELTPEPDWQPDWESALLRLHERRSRRAVITRRVVLASAALAACVCVTAVMEFRGVAAADRTLKDRQAAPDFTLKDANGVAIRLSDYKHKVVLVNFWATWCHGCKQEIPWLMELHNKYKDRGFTTIGISMDDDGFKAVKPYSEKAKMNYPVVIGDKRLAKLYGVESMPETLLVGRAGRIAAVHIGVIERESLEREIRGLLD